MAKKFARHHGQPKWVLRRLKNKRNGFFVELGAFNGLDESNTLGMERKLGWQGICIEPVYFEELQQNRKCQTVQACCCATDGGTTEMFKSKRRSAALFALESPDKWKWSREVVSVPVRTLTSILDECKAPSVIDYLSLDVEGAESEVLKGLDLDKYRFRTITMEVNKPSAAPAIEQLEAAGYKCVHKIMNGGKLLDNCYVLPGLKG